MSISASIVIRAMVDGKLKAYSENRNDRFSGLLFSLQDLVNLQSTSFGLGKKGDRQGEAKSYVSLKCAASMVGMHEQSLYRAVELGLLKARAGAGGRSTWWIEVGELKGFADQYTTNGQLAREHGVPANRIKQVAKRLEITPAGSRDGAYNEYPIYKKDDLKRARFSNALMNWSPQ